MKKLIQLFPIDDFYLFHLFAKVLEHFARRVDGRAWHLGAQVLDLLFHLATGVGKYYISLKFVCYLLCKTLILL